MNNTDVTQTGKTDTTDTTLPPALSLIKYESEISRKRIAYALVTILIFCMVGGIGFLVFTSTKNIHKTNAKASFSGVQLSFAQELKTGQVGEIHNVGIILNPNGNSVSAAELQLSYDPMAIEIVQFKPEEVSFPIVLESEHHNEGKMIVTLGADLASPLKTAGVIGVLKIKIIAEKESTIRFLQTTQVSALGKNKNVLEGTTTCKIIGTNQLSTQ